jgi:uncharacterized protein YkwD
MPAETHTHSRATKLRLAAVGATLAAAMALPSPALAADGCANANANPNDISLAAAKSSTICLLNRERRSRGLRGFKRNGKLSLASTRHARDMARRGYFAHGDFAGRIRATHYLSGVRTWTIGENIAWGSQDYATPREIVRGWMNSPGHRANILSSRFREIGIGVARGAPVGGMRQGGTYVTDFGARG